MSDFSQGAEVLQGESLLALFLLRFDEALAILDASPDFSKAAKLRRVLDAARRVLMQTGGCAALEQRAQALEVSGVYLGSDWAYPQILLPALSCHALRSADIDVMLFEVLSNLRMLAVSRGLYEHPELSAEEANHHLVQVMAMNLELLFSQPDEERRINQGKAAVIPQCLFDHLLQRIGYEHIIDGLIDEIWRLLKQRPIQIEPLRQMITRIAVCQANPAIDFGAGGQGADRLVSALFGPTEASREDPGTDVYKQRLAGMDRAALQYEATGAARAMHDTGLVSPYHAVLMRHLASHDDYESLVPEAMGLSSTGRECLLCYRGLVIALIEAVVQPQTAQSVYGLALTLERGILYQPPLAPALWRQLQLIICGPARARLAQIHGSNTTAEKKLLEGLLCMLGQPMGVGQGNNPTCQAARALSMWAYNDPDYLLQMIVWAARDDEVIMHFEGEAVSSAVLPDGLAKDLHLDLDPVSVLLVPHLDRIYTEMGRRCSARGEDPHRWVNPEFHGWWSGRGFRIAVDVASGKLQQLEDFLRYFCASYHPFYNGSQPVIHPQPAGIAVTDSAARFIGWHAITILRVNLDHGNDMRVYFFNPNNDSGQNWGQGVVVSTAGNGERFGESSLPFVQFASRLYLFHYDPLEPGSPDGVDAALLHEISSLVTASWGIDRQ